MRIVLIGFLLAATIPGAPVTFTIDHLFDVAGANVADVSDDGRWLAVVSGRLRDRIGADNHRFGDPTYIPPGVAELLVIDTASGAISKPFGKRESFRSPKFSPDGRRLAVLVRSGDAFELRVWDRVAVKFTRVAMPDGRVLDASTQIAWTPDGERVIFTVRAADWPGRAAEAFRRETSAPIVVQSSKEPFLNWIALRRLELERSVTSCAVSNGGCREIAPKTALQNFRASEDGTLLVLQEDIAKKTDYDTLGFGEAQISALAVTEGAKPRVVMKSNKGLSLQWSRDLKMYAYAKEGGVYVAGIDDKEPRLLIGRKRPAPGSEPPPPAEGERKAEESFALTRLSPKGDRLIASNKEGLWLVAIADGAKDLMVRSSEEDKLAPRFQVIDFSPDGELVYLTRTARTAWDRAVLRYSARSKKLDELYKSPRSLSGLRLSRDGSRWVFSSSEPNQPEEVHTAGAEFTPVRALTDSNPQLKDVKLSKAELVNYLDVDGKRQSGVLYYPADYEKGKKYPTVFIVYEQFFDPRFNGTLNFLTANGYAVMEPSVEFETGYPGEAWMKAVTAAANKLIEMGVADPEKLGVHGTSYGGYATNLLITQTNRFKAAINISGKVDMISFYTDSPRLGVRNTHAPEKSQDRIGATLWQQPQKYIQHSAIFFADRIKTPLLLITGEQDHNVPARQAMEMYYALRRLGKEVTWVSYTNGGHGMPTSTIEEVKDYHQRILGWYDDHLKKPEKKAAVQTEGQ